MTPIIRRISTSIVSAWLLVALIQPAGMAAPAAGEPSDPAKIRNWARATVQKHDKNGDMILDKEEQAGLGQSAKADLDGDGKITVDELVAFQTPKPAGSPPAATSSSSESSSSSHEPTKAAKPKRKSFRFKRAKERLPAGLPGWFASKDANGDGQVSMSEYGRSWSDRTAAEFQRLDRDNDGVITAKESQKGK